MRIVFNLQRVGLGNNGGSRTIIKCAETLQELGHSAILWCSNNNYKWSKIKVPVSKKMPSCDVIVATGYHSVVSTLSAKVARKFYYIRGFELWQASEEKLLRSYKSLNCIVNSEWLLNYMNDHEIKAKLIYPGLDFDIFGQDNNIRKNIIGGIYSKKHNTKRHEDVIEVGRRLGRKVLLLNRDIVSPTPESLRKFYNKIQVWMSPSELEGLHNCPMEAAMCGCGLVVTDHSKGGTFDYSIDKDTALIYSARRLDEACDRIEVLMNNNSLRKRIINNMNTKLKHHIGTRKQNMTKLISLMGSKSW